MKRFLVAMVTAMFLLCVDRCSGAVVVEGFEDYNVGDQLHGLDGGSGWLGPWDVGTETRRAEVTIVDDGLDYANEGIFIDGGDRALQYAFTEGEVNVISTRSMPSQPGTLYMSLLYRDIVDDDPLGTGDDFLQFGLLDEPDNPTVSAINGDGEFQVRYGTPAGNSMDSEVKPAVDQTYLLVLKAEKTAGAATYDKLTLFVDPTSLYEALNASVTVVGDSGLDLSSDAFFVIRKAFHESGDTAVVDRLLIVETFVEAVTDSVPTLAWANAVGGEWSELDGGQSRWRDPAYPGTPVANVPDATVHAILDAGDATTVSVGQVGSLTVREALRLSVDRGTIAIRDGSTLNVTATADFAVGTMLELGTGATIAAGGGTIDHIATEGDATIGTHSGTLTVGRIDDRDNPGVLEKTGWGTLVLDNTAGGSNLARTQIDVAAGTLSAIGANPLAGATKVTLREGTTLRLQNVPVVAFGTGLTESWFDGATVGVNEGSLATKLDPLLGLETPGSIDVYPGLLGRLPGDAQTPLDRALSYDTNDMNSRSQGVTGLDFFAAVWHGTMTVASSGSGAPIEAGTLTLGIASDDGSAFWIDKNPDPGTADWQMIVDNRGLHVEQIRVGNVTLAAGTYDVAIPYYEKDGEEAIEVRFQQGAIAGTPNQVWNQLTHVLDPSDAQQFGIWDGSNIDLIDRPALDLHEGASITVRDRSTIEAITDYDARFGLLEMEQGILTTTGAREGIHFAAASLLGADATVGIDAEVPTTLNDIDGNSHENVTFTKTGPADLIVEGTGVGLDQTTFDVKQGRLVVLGTSNPIGGATLQLDGGDVVLSAGQADSTDLVIAADATVTTSASHVVLRDLTVADGVGTVTLENAEYTFQDVTVADGVTIDGNLRIEGVLDIGNGIGEMTVGNGELALTETSTYRAEVSLAGLDAGADVIEVSENGTLQLGGTLVVVGIDRTDFNSWGNVTLRIVDNTSGGTLGGAFDAVVPAPGTTSASHVGQSSTVPEPCTAAMLLATLLGLAGLARVRH